MIEKIEYSNKDSICYVVIDEDILENGDVPLSQSYIINQAGHKFPLCSSFRAIRTKSQYVLNPLEQMIIENMQLDDE